jgi:hypothetical protein
LGRSHSLGMEMCCHKWASRAEISIFWEERGGGYCFVGTREADDLD